MLSMLLLHYQEDRSKVGAFLEGLLVCILRGIDMECDL